jgi:hypothetical protein
MQIPNEYQTETRRSYKFPGDSFEMKDRSSSLGQGQIEVRGIKTILGPQLKNFPA